MSAKLLIPVFLSRPGKGIEPATAKAGARSADTSFGDWLGKILTAKGASDPAGAETPSRETIGNEEKGPRHLLDLLRKGTFPSLAAIGDADTPSPESLPGAAAEIPDGAGRAGEPAPPPGPSATGVDGLREVPVPGSRLPLLADGAISPTPALAGGRVPGTVRPPGAPAPPAPGESQVVNGPFPLSEAARATLAGRSQSAAPRGIPQTGDPRDLTGAPRPALGRAAIAGRAAAATVDAVTEAPSETAGSGSGESAAARVPRTTPGKPVVLPSVEKISRMVGTVTRDVDLAARIAAAATDGQPGVRRSVRGMNDNRAGNGEPDARMSEAVLSRSEKGSGAARFAPRTPPADVAAGARPEPADPGASDDDAKRDTSGEDRKNGTGFSRAIRRVLEQSVAETRSPLHAPSGRSRATTVLEGPRDADSLRPGSRPPSPETRETAARREPAIEEAATRTSTDAELGSRDRETVGVRVLSRADGPSALPRPEASPTPAGGPSLPTASAAPTETTTLLVRHEALAQAIVARARAHPRNGAVELRFALQPEELGAVRVRMEAHGHQIKIEIAATSQAAADTITSGLDRLSSQLNDAGYRHPQVTVSLADSGGTGPGHGQHDTNGSQPGHRFLGSGGSRASGEAAASDLGVGAHDAGRLNRLA